jgi:16S rRNA processing protein RimM
MDNAFNSTSATPTASGDAAASWDDMLLVGVIARTQGRAGEVIVNATTDFPELRFAPGASLWGRPPEGPPERVTVVAMRLHLGRPVLALDGVTSIGEAERYAGWELRVPDERQVLPPHVYYRYDLIGCEVVTAAGERVGVVRTVDGEGGAVRLVVTASGGEVLIPLAQEMCAVDVGRRRIVVTPPDGLLEVNGAWR